MAPPKSRPDHFLWPASHSRFLKQNNNWEPVYDVWTTAGPDDILFPGSEDDDKDDSDKHRAKRRRRENIARSYLRGKDLQFVWALSKGPFPGPETTVKPKPDQSGAPAVPCQDDTQPAPQQPPTCDEHAGNETAPVAPSPSHVQQYHDATLDTWDDDQDSEAPDAGYRQKDHNLSEEEHEVHTVAPDTAPPVESSDDESDAAPELPATQTVPVRISTGRLSDARGVLSGQGIIRRPRSPSVDHTLAPLPSGSALASYTTAPEDSRTDRASHRPHRTSSIFSRRSRPQSRTPEPRPGDVFNMPSKSTRPQATPSRPPRSSPLPSLTRPAVAESTLLPRIPASNPQPLLRLATESELTEFESVPSPLSEVSARSAISSCFHAPQAAKSSTRRKVFISHDHTIVEDGIVRTAEDGARQEYLHDQSHLRRLAHPRPTIATAPVSSSHLYVAVAANKLRSDDALSTVPSHTPSVLRESFATTVQSRKSNAGPSKADPSNVMSNWDLAPPTGFTPINQRLANLCAQLDEHTKNASTIKTLTMKTSTKQPREGSRAKTYQVTGPAGASPFVFRKAASDDKANTPVAESALSKSKKPKGRKILFDSSMDLQKPSVLQSHPSSNEEAGPVAEINGEPNLQTSDAVPAIDMSFHQESLGVHFDLIDRFTNSIIPVTGTLRKKKSVSDELRKAMRESGASLVGDYPRRTSSTHDLPAKSASPISASKADVGSPKDTVESTQDCVAEEAGDTDQVVEDFPYFSTQAAMAQAHRNLIGSSPVKAIADDSVAIDETPISPSGESPVNTIKTFQDFNEEMAITTATQVSMPMPSTQALLEMYSPIVQSTEKEGRKKAMFITSSALDHEGVDARLAQRAVDASAYVSNPSKAGTELPSDASAKYCDVRSSMSPDTLPPSQKSGSQLTQKVRRQSLHPPSGSVSLSEVFDCVSTQRGGRKLNHKTLLSQESLRQSPRESSQSKKRNKTVRPRRSLRSSLRSCNSLAQDWGVAPPSSAPPTSKSRFSLIGSTTIADGFNDDTGDEIVVNTQQPPSSTMPNMRCELSQPSQSGSTTIPDELVTDTYLPQFSTLPDGRADRGQSQGNRTQLNSELTPLPLHGTRPESTPGQSGRPTERAHSSYQLAQRMYGKDVDLDTTIDELTASVLTPWDLDTATSRLLEASSR